MSILVRDSVFLITAGSDQKVILWEIETGVELVSYTHSGSVRSVCFNESGTQFVSCCDGFSDHPPSVTVFEFNRDDPASSNPNPIKKYVINFLGFLFLWCVFITTIYLSIYFHL